MQVGETVPCPFHEARLRFMGGTVHVRAPSPTPLPPSPPFFYFLILFLKNWLFITQQFYPTAAHNVVTVRRATKQNIPRARKVVCRFLSKVSVTTLSVKIIHRNRAALFEGAPPLFPLNKISSSKFISGEFYLLFRFIRLKLNQLGFIELLDMYE